MARRRLRKAEREAGGAFILVMFLMGIAYTIFSALVEFIQSREGKILLVSVAVLALSIYLVKKKIRNKKEKILAAERLKKQMKYEEELSKVDVSTSRHDYIIDSNDYKRGTSRERIYRTTFQLTLLQCYENRCAKCGSNDNGVDLDHFFLSKNEGGNFILRGKNGLLVNNAIPLCKSCNRSKSDRSFRSFFSEDEILRIFQKNVIMTKIVNDRGPLDSEGNVVKSRRSTQTA